MPVAKRMLLASVVGTVVVILSVAAFRLLPPTYPTGDRAFLELYTSYATEGNLAVGPYSRFGWNHPGPAYFYALAPFYALGGQREFSLGAAALAINLAVLAGLIVVVSKAGERFLDWSLIAAIAIYLFRPGPVRDVSELLASPWNPHIVALPFGLLIGLCAALAVGWVQVMPAIALVSSFVIQTHIGLLPCTFALCASAFLLRTRFAEQRVASVRPWTLASLAVLAMLWVIPLWDQVLGSGNAGEIIRFFLSDNGGARPSLSIALSAVAYGLSAAVRPYENLAMGNVLISASALGSLAVVWTALQVFLLPVVVWWAARERRPFHSSLGVLCLVTTVVAGWSALNVRGPMRDYLVFWMSAVGVVNVTVLAAAAACWAASALRHRGIVTVARVGPKAATTFLLLVCFVGTSGLVQDYRRTLAGDGRFPVRREAVRVLFEGLEDRIRTEGYDSVRIRMVPQARVVAAGVVLQLQKAGIPIAVADPWVPMFTEALRSTATHDVVFHFVGRELDAEFRHRSDQVVIARHRSVSVYERVR